jgi:glutamine synthetase
MLNAAVAEALGEFERDIKARTQKGAPFQEAVLSTVKEAVVATKAVRFEGNNYAPEWVEEAAKRGLLNLRTSPEALAELVKPDTKAFLHSLKIFTEAESEARYHVKMERYLKDVEIEVETLKSLVSGHVFPAAYRQRALLASAGNSRPVQQALSRLESAISDLDSRVEELAKHMERASKAGGLEKQARVFADSVVPAMAAIREVSDTIEEEVADEFWTLPKYHEMLFLV